MQHIDGIDGIRLEGSLLTIGSFDGVHLGHQAIVRQLVSEAKQAGVPAAVLTFHPHPSVILQTRARVRYLTSPEERADLLGDLGVDFVLTHPFSHEFSLLQPAEFLDLIQAHLQFTGLFVGPDFAFGHNRQGTVEYLRQEATLRGFELTVISQTELSGKRVRSSAVRQALIDGDVQGASDFLGRPYRLPGRAVTRSAAPHDESQSEFSLDFWPERALPGAGAYAARVETGDREFGALVYMIAGAKSKDGGASDRVEIRLLDGGTLSVEQQIGVVFLKSIRVGPEVAGLAGPTDEIEADLRRLSELVEAGLTT